MSALADLRAAADAAAERIAATHPDPDLYDIRTDPNTRERVILARYELDELAEAVDELRAILADITDETTEK